MALFGFKIVFKNGPIQFGVIEHDDNTKGLILRQVALKVEKELRNLLMEGDEIIVMPAEDLIKEQYNGFCYLTNTITG